MLGLMLCYFHLKFSLVLAQDHTANGSPGCLWSAAGENCASLITQEGICVHLLPLHPGQIWSLRIITGILFISQSRDFSRDSSRPAGQPRALGRLRLTLVKDVPCLGEWQSGG